MADHDRVDDDSVDDDSVDDDSVDDHVDVDEDADHPDVENADADRYLVDVMCGSLATYLRMCGYDAAYALERRVEEDDVLLALAREEDRRLVTRDRELAGRAEDAIALTARDVRDQLRTLAEAGIRLELPGEPRRCSNCNGDCD